MISYYAVNPGYFDKVSLMLANIGYSGSHCTSTTLAKDSLLFNCRGGTLDSVDAAGTNPAGEDPFMCYESWRNEMCSGNLGTISGKFNS